jgi:hypothetical protein
MSDFNWRAHLPVHPAADRFPLLSESELKELAEDIRKNGLQCPIVIRHQENDSDQLIDGRNRLDALALLGLISSRVRSPGLPPIQIKHPEGFAKFDSLPDLNYGIEALTAMRKLQTLSSLSTSIAGT